MTVRSLAPFIAAAIAEIGGAYLVWIGLCDGGQPEQLCPCHGCQPDTDGYSYRHGDCDRNVNGYSYGYGHRHH